MKMFETFNVTTKKLEHAVYDLKKQLLYMETSPTKAQSKIVWHTREY